MSEDASVQLPDEEVCECRVLTAEEAREIDDALGLVELPPIRLRAHVYECVKVEADARSMVVQAYVRLILARWADNFIPIYRPPSPLE